MLKLMCWWIERSSSFAFIGFPVACLSFLLSFVSFTVTKGCMGTKGSMDQRTKPLCSPVTCVFTNSLPLVFFFFLLLCSFFFLFSPFFLLFFCSPLLLFFLYSLLSFLIFCSLFPAPVRSLEGLIYSLNISLFRKDSIH